MADQQSPFAELIAELKDAVAETRLRAAALQRAQDAVARRYTHATADERDRAFAAYQEAVSMEHGAWAVAERFARKCTVPSRPNGVRRKTPRRRV